MITICQIYFIKQVVRTTYKPIIPSPTPPPPQRPHLGFWQGLRLDLRIVIDLTSGPTLKPSSSDLCTQWNCDILCATLRRRQKYWMRFHWRRERETSWRLAERHHHTLCRFVAQRAWTSSKGQRFDVSSDCSKIDRQQSAMPHYQDIAFQASGENDYITLAGMERAASPQPEVYENPLVLPTTGSERQQMRRADRRTSHSEENEEESTIHSSEDVSRQRSQSALHLSSQPITRETGHVSKDPAKQPGAFQERNIRTVFGCLLLFCLLISVGSGVLAGLAFSRASSSSGGYNQLQQPSSLLSMSSSTTSGSKGEMLIQN